jgi:hypothetical protein
MGCGNWQKVVAASADDPAATVVRLGEQCAAANVF